MGACAIVDAKVMRDHNGLQVVTGTANMSTSYLDSGDTLNLSGYFSGNCWLFVKRLDGAASTGSTNLYRTKYGSHAAATHKIVSRATANGVVTSNTTNQKPNQITFIAVGCP